MSKVSKVSYGLTKSVNFQSRRIEVEVTLEEGDTFKKALHRAKALCAQGLMTPEEIAAAKKAAAIVHYRYYEDEPYHGDRDD